MSLFSLISGSNTASSYTSGTTSPAVQKALAAAGLSTDGAALMATASTAATSDVSISAAAAEKADNAKDFTDLSNQVRATLDAQYAGAKANGDTNPSPDLSGMTGRALAAIVLNKTGNFSRSEVNAAKSALDKQTRQEFASAMANGTGLSAIGAYGQSLVSEYDAMSPEERQARGWTESFRATAEMSATASTSSLFDTIDE